MANTYTYTGPGERFAAGEPTDEAAFNLTRANIDHLYESLNTVTDTDEADGVLLTGTQAMRIGDPMRVEVSAGVVWTIGWWQAANGTWWLLGNTADVASFTRAQAEFYIPNRKVVATEVPTS
jgi:hypothetical protein